MDIDTLRNAPRELHTTRLLLRAPSVVRHRERDPEGQLCGQVLLSVLPCDLVQLVAACG